MKLTLTVMLKMIQNDCSGISMARRRVLLTFEALRCCVVVKFMRYFPADQVGQCRSVQALFPSASGCQLRPPVWNIECLKLDSIFLILKCHERLCFSKFILIIFLVIYSIIIIADVASDVAIDL
jgi:hypothetical protein